MYKYIEDEASDLVHSTLYLIQKAFESWTH